MRGTAQRLLGLCAGLGLVATMGFITAMPASAATLGSITPSSGSTRGGDTVVLTGTGFTGAVNVGIAGRAVSYTVDSDTQITFVTSSYSLSGLSNVQVQAADGSWAMSPLFTYTPSTQLITFANPGSQVFGTTPSLVATSNPESPVTLSVTFTSTTPEVCAVTSGGALTFYTAGTCTINADQAGNSAYLVAPTVPQSFSVTPVVPGAPTAVSASAGDGAATVSFAAPVDTGGEAVSSYRVTSSGGPIQTGSSSPIVVTGLTNGTPYTFTVEAYNSIGWGSASNVSASVTPRAPQVITFANPGSQAFGTTPSLVAMSDSSLSVTFTSTTPGVCSVTSGGSLTSHTAGTCAINADQVGNSAYLAAPTVPQSFSVTPVVPGAPTAVSVSAGDRSATVSFAAPIDTGGEAVSSYLVTSSGGQMHSGSSSPIVVTGLTNGTAYTFTVTASNTAGESLISDPTDEVIPISPPPIPASPTSQTATNSSTGANPNLATGQPVPTELKSGVGSLLIDGVATPVVVEKSADGKDVIISGGGVRLVLSATGVNGQPLPLGPDGSLVLSAAGGIPMVGSGFAAGSTVTLFMFSTPVTLGAATVNADGAYSTTAVIPGSTATGSHTIQVVGTSTSGQPIALSLGVTIASDQIKANRMTLHLNRTRAHTAGSRFSIEARGVQAGCGVKFRVKGSTATARAGSNGVARVRLTSPRSTSLWTITARVGASECSPATANTRLRVITH